MSIPTAKLLTTGFALIAMTISACAPVATYPDRGDRIVSTDPNLSPMPAVVAEALAHCVLFYPVEGPYIINPPQGQSRKTAIWIRSRLGDDDAYIVERDNTHLPVYHVDDVIIRGKHAEVEVLCPVWTANMSYDTPPYERAYRRVLIRLTGAFQDWNYDNARSWPPRLMDPPQLYGWDQ